MKMNRRTRTIKGILGIVGFIAFLLTLGTVGSMEINEIGFKEGFIWSTIGLIVLGLCVSLNNCIDEELERQRRVKARRARRLQQQDLKTNSINGHSLTE